MGLYKSRIWDKEGFDNPDNIHVVGPAGNLGNINPVLVSYYCEMNGHKWYSDGEPYSSGIWASMTNEEWLKCREWSKTK